MTPAERARQIDKEEFEAECAAIRQRALLFTAQRRHDERVRTALWLGRTPPVLKFVPTFVAKPKPAKVKAPKQYKPHPTAHLFTHAGNTLTLKQWAEVTGISPLSLRSRIANGWCIHDALTVPVNPVGRNVHRGVVSNLPASLGTGGGSASQDSGNITFSMEA